MRGTQRARPAAVTIGRIDAQNSRELTCWLAMCLRYILGAPLIPALGLHACHKLLFHLGCFILAYPALSCM